jgi:hypothetical protein
VCVCLINLFLLLQFSCNTNVAKFWHFSLCWTVAHTVRHCKILMILTKHIFWYHITVFHHIEWHSMTRKVCWPDMASAGHVFRTAVMKCLQTHTHSIKYLSNQVACTSASFLASYSLFQHNDFSFISASSINQYVKVIIKLSNVIIHIQTGVYLELSLCVQVEHVR